MSLTRGRSMNEYRSLRQRAGTAVEGNRLDEALELFDRAFEWATTHGDECLRDRAWCNRVAVALEISGGTGSLKQLQEILLRNSDVTNCFHAAYTLARAYDLRKDYSKALFYARIANKHAVKLRRRDKLAMSHNQIGNLLVADSYFDEAMAEYEEALRLLPPEPSVRRALALYNLGYCYTVKGRAGEGFSALIAGLRLLHRFGARRLEPGARLALAFAYLQIGRYRPALRHAAAALTIAEDGGDVGSIKYALFLLGETCKQAGDEHAALDHFQRLQESYYPDAPYLPDMLLLLDVQSFINIKA
jgi:tetratricopeptide (TPR) repeat protein